MLEHRDYTLILDKSGSMATKDQSGRSRWQAARESTEAFAHRCDALDPDGLTLYVFAGKFRRYERVTADRVATVFVENEPCGSTDLAAVLDHAFDRYFERKVSSALPRPETVLVVTDGAPDDEKAVMKSILRAAKRVHRQDELVVTFIQIGNDPGARRFLKILDEEMVKAGAPFDIISTVDLDEAEGLGLTEVLLGSLRGKTT